MLPPMMVPELSEVQELSHVSLPKKPPSITSHDEVQELVQVSPPEASTMSLPCSPRLQPLNTVAPDAM
jgi:hypothetical protein